MTALADRPATGSASQSEPPDASSGDGAATGAAPSPATSSRPPAPAEPKRLSARAQIALAVLLLAVLALGFGAYLFGLSGLSEARSQQNLRKTFTNTLAKAIAPLGPVDYTGAVVAEGTPVIALSIPRLGLSQAIVVQGTSSRDLMLGPGHRVDTIMPGQCGTSVIFGKAMTSGAPFSDLMTLQPGDMIYATTGQGVAKYKVSSFGNQDTPAPANSDNRLVLATTNTGLVPRDTLSVSADLVSKCQPSPGVGVSTSDQDPLATSFAASLLPALLWSQALLMLAIAVPFGLHRWRPSAVYLCAAPLAMAILWNLYENVAAMLPNLY